MHSDDKIWIYERRMLSGGLYPEFVPGVNRFLGVAFAHAQLWESRKLNVLVINAQLVTCTPVIKCYVICTTMSSYIIIMHGGFMERMTILLS